MSFTPAMDEAVETMTALLNERLADHEDDVVAVLTKASTGDLPMVETLTDSDRAIMRTIFGLLVDIGPGTLWKELQPVMGTVLSRAKDGSNAGDHKSSILGLFDKILHGLVARGSRMFSDHGLPGVAVLTPSYVFYEDFHDPQPEKGVYDVAGTAFEKVKWIYRYWFNQIEVVEQGSGLADFFADQVLTPGHLPELAAASTRSVVSLSCAGDLLAVDVLVPENTDRLFEDIADFYSSADIVSANLESTVSKDDPIGRHQSPGLAAQMNTSQDMFDRFVDDAKINYFSVATNHCLDWGERGILNTLDVLAKSGAHYSGTAASQAEQDDVVVVDRNGIKVGLLSFTFDVNDQPWPDGKPYLANMVRVNDADPAPDYTLVERHVAAAKAKGAEYIVAYCHWGWEFEMHPHANVVKAAHEIVARGVDVILGNHPHVSQPAQVIERDGKPNALVTYAFGDFVSYHPYSRNSKFAWAIKFDIEKIVTGDDTVVSWRNLQALPIYIVNSDLGDGRYDCRIVKFENVLADPDGYGLTDREKSELPHLRDVVWDKILAPLSHIPADG